ncbi:GTPase [Aeromicrobium yanjiei]|uniref:G domain-containing protein n=1 Tax=Aeromicrobium yanjiei TaxID=2662028 RepID=A0A5Q2MJC7_9ACTN|nr:GTPase [Aeromicrobium yanjiei]QGG41849.1 hypothetical protein GEV26_11000 [Aeromicrobium yanjiei]
MTKILIHELPAQTRKLETRLRAAIAAIEHPDRDSLLSRLRFGEREVPQLVLTGLYSSGKSSLIKALTDGDASVDIAVDVATDAVRGYEWGGDVLLVDTPGVQAGLEEHDSIAESALAAADMVLFTVSVDMFDDTSSAHLRHVAFELGKLDQMLLIVTKSGTMSAAVGIRQSNADAALGVPGHLRVVECDSVDYMTGMMHDDPERANEYIEGSGIDNVRRAINALAETRGQLAVDRQPLQLIRALAMEAGSFVTEDPNESAALALLARQRGVLATRQQRIERQVASLRTAFMSAAIASAELFVDAIEDADELAQSVGERTALVDVAEADLNASLDLAAAKFGQAVTQMLKLQFDNLTAEIREIESSPHARVVSNIGAGVTTVDTTKRSRFVARRGAKAATHTSAPPWTADVQDYLKTFQTFWGAGTGVKASSGTAGHKIVTEVGHRFGVKFKPWQAARTSNYIGKAAKGAGTAIQVGLVLNDAVFEERRRRELDRARRTRRANMVSEVTTQANLIAADLVDEVRGHLRPLFDRAFADIDAVYGEIISNREDQGALSVELSAIASEADSALSAS